MCIPRMDSLLLINYRYAVYIGNPGLICLPIMKISMIYDITDVSLLVNLDLRIELQTTILRISSANFKAVSNASFARYGSSACTVKHETDTLQHCKHETDTLQHCKI